MRAKTTAAVRAALAIALLATSGGATSACSHGGDKKAAAIVNTGGGVKVTVSVCVVVFPATSEACTLMVLAPMFSIS